MFIVDKLRVATGGRQVVDNVDFKLGSGSITVLMGPNGSGKTTIGQALMGHPDYQVEVEKIELDGVDLRDLSPSQRAQAGLFLAFQHPISVEGVRYGKFLWQLYQLRFKHGPTSSAGRITSVLAFQKYLFNLARQLGIKDSLLERSLNQDLSGGEKKRLELLQLLVLEPKYAVLDEPDSGLDVDALKISADNIKLAVNRFNLGVLLITHHRHILDHLEFDKVLVMKDGKIVKKGDRELVKQLEKEGYKGLG